MIRHRLIPDDAEERATKCGTNLGSGGERGVRTIGKYQVEAFLGFVVVDSGLDGLGEQEVTGRLADVGGQRHVEFRGALPASSRVRPRRTV